MTKNLPEPVPEYSPEAYDYMVASILDMVVDGVPHQAVWDLCFIAQNHEQFYAGMQAMVELGDIINDHCEREPDDGTYDEEDEFLREEWGTEGDDFDPPEDWFDEGGPFGPEDPDL